MQDKKQIIGLILSVVLSVGLVVVGVNAATTVGNNVSVGGTLAVTGTSTLTVGEIVGGDLAASMDLTVVATTSLSGDVVLGDAAGDKILITGTPTISPTTTFSAGATFGGDVTASLDLNVSIDLTVTATTTLNGDITLGNATADNIRIIGNITGNPVFLNAVTFSASTTHTGTSTFNGDVTLGDAAGDNIKVLGTISSATTTLLSIGGGQVIAKHLSGTASISLGTILANGCATGTVTVTGAAVGDVVALGVPHSVMTASTTLTFAGWVSVADTVSVRVCQVAASQTGTFAAATFRADVWQH